MIESELTSGFRVEPGRVYGFFTDTSLCIGCKACEVACKQWNNLPADELRFHGNSYDNTGSLGHHTWRHVKFVEQPGRWLFQSDICKHCEQAGCLDACPTGAIVRTEFGSVLIQQDVCNGCKYCVPACPFGVITTDETGGGTAHKCTLCYDRLKDSLEPACAKACPTDSIQFGPLDDLRERAERRVAALHSRGFPQAQLYGDPSGAGATHGVDSLRSFFLLLDHPNAYNLPDAPRLPTRNVLPGALTSLAATMLLVSAAGALLGAGLAGLLASLTAALCALGAMRVSAPNRSQRALQPSTQAPARSRETGSSEHALAADDDARPPDPGSGLRAAVERTGNRASLDPAYLEGHAPMNQRTRQDSAPSPASYYGLPAIKRPDWLWFIPAYFFLGGLASGAAILSALLDVSGRAEARSAVRAGRYLSLVALALSPLLLIADLGRPERFLNMLRVFKPRSVMNLGSWGLLLLGGFCGAGAGAQLLQDLFPRSALARSTALALRLVSWLGVLPAMFVGSYTGMLLAATNVPLWVRSRLFIGPLFFASGLSSASAAIQLTAPLLGKRGTSAEAGLQRVETLALLCELALTTTSQVALGPLGAPLRSGRWGAVYQLGAVGLGILAPLGISRVDGSMPASLGISRMVGSMLAPLGLSRLGRLRLRRVSPLLVLLGSLAMRFAFVEAGKRQADDPLAYFQSTRRA